MYNIIKVYFMFIDKIIIEQFPLSNITKFMAEAVARNFNLLFSYSGVAESTHIPTELKISVETLNVIEIFSRFAFVVRILDVC